MDIAGLSMAMASTNLQNKVGTAMLGKAMDTNEALGQGLNSRCNCGLYHSSSTGDHLSTGARCQYRLTTVI